MKINVYLKDPDGFSESIDDAVKADVKALGLPADEAKALIEVRRQKASDALMKWVEYGEYVAIDFDTDAGTATVVVRK